MLPTQVATWTDSLAVSDFVQDFLAFDSLGYNAVYIGLIIFFAYFYTGVLFNPDDVAENIRKNGGYIPGIRPGKRTAEYIERVLSRVTLIGALYLSVVCVMPLVLSAQFNVPFWFGGTTLLIVVGVALDLVGQIEAHLVTRNYESFVAGGRIRGRAR
jgi:preprotein translocase subunit SecY